jgi:hypothetical protein
VKINVELSLDRHQFANLFFVRVLPVMRLTRPLFRMVSRHNQRLRRKPSRVAKSNLSTKAFSQQSASTLTVSQAKRVSGCDWRIARDAARVVQQLPQCPDEVVVVFVRADPKPDDEIAVLLCNSAIVIADSHRPDVASKRLELQ